jgi:branched-chain amino acid transport system ATP-binding protein
MALLDVRNLSVTFGAVAAVADVSLSVESGTLVGLIGSNGAGKTTALDALTGFVEARGSAQFEGTELLHLPAHRRTALGISRTWQSIELFDDLTIFDNLCVAASGTNLRGVLKSAVWSGQRRDRTEMRQLMETLELDDVLDRYPEELSEGERKLVGLSRTLMSRPKLVLADEPAAGLDSNQSIRLGSRLRALVDSGLTLLLVDHDMGLVLGVCDQIYVLDHGQLIASGTPEEIRSNPAVLGAYLGDMSATSDADVTGQQPEGSTTATPTGDDA